MCADVTMGSPVRKSIGLTRQMHDAIASEIEARVKRHQNAIARLRSAPSRAPCASRNSGVVRLYLGSRTKSVWGIADVARAWFDRTDL
jgi:hypothetical protein